MAEWVEAAASKPEDLSSIPESPMAEGLMPVTVL